MNVRRDRTGRNRVRKPPRRAELSAATLRRVPELPACRSRANGGALPPRWQSRRRSGRPRRRISGSKGAARGAEPNQPSSASNHVSQQALDNIDELRPPLAIGVLTECPLVPGAGRLYALSFVVQ